jgi:hypothetical protein
MSRASWVWITGLLIKIRFRQNRRLNHYTITHGKRLLFVLIQDDGQGRKCSLFGVLTSVKLLSMKLKVNSGRTNKNILTLTLYSAWHGSMNQTESVLWGTSACNMTTHILTFPHEHVTASRSRGNVNETLWRCSVCVADSKSAQWSGCKVPLL